MKKLIWLGLLPALYLYANQGNDILAFEKIMSDLHDKKSQETSSQQKENNSNQQQPLINVGAEYNFNVIGAYSVDDKWYAYLLTSNNQLIKVEDKLVLGNKEIVSITKHGINVKQKDGAKETTYFLPIVQQKVDDKDIGFFNKKEKKQ